MVLIENGKNKERVFREQKRNVLKETFGSFRFKRSIKDNYTKVIRNPGMNK